MNNKQTTRQSSTRAKFEADVLEAYNIHRKQKKESPSECYTSVGREFNINFYQVQYIILKAKKAGKKVL